MAVFEPESLNLLPDREILHCVCYKDWRRIKRKMQLKWICKYMGVKQMPEERREGTKGEKLEKKEGEEVADVDPIHPTEARGGKKRSLLDTCK